VRDSTKDIIGFSVLGGLVVAATCWFYLGIQDTNSNYNNMLGEMYFRSCVKEDSTIEMRRACGRYAEAVVNNHADYQAFDKILTYDKYAHQYIVKEVLK